MNFADLVIGNVSFSGLLPQVSFEVEQHFVTYGALCLGVVRSLWFVIFAV